MSVNVNFYNYYLLETAVKIKMRSLSWKKNSEKIEAFEGPPNLLRQAY